MAPKSVKYGAWKSPISSAFIAESSITLAGMTQHQGEVYWVEGQPIDAERRAASLLLTVCILLLRSSDRERPSRADPLGR
jgi:hypothetical protein